MLNFQKKTVSKATAFRPSRLTFQPILRENRVASRKVSANHNDAYMSKHKMTQWSIYLSPQVAAFSALIESLGLDRVVTVYMV